MNVFEKAHELGAMIAESAEFKKVNEAREAQSADNDAALVLMNYNRKRDQLIKEASDPEISNERMQEIRNEMEREVDKLNNNKTIADFMEAMQAFNDMMDQVNGIVEIPGEEFSMLVSNCSSCGGCH